MDEKHHISDPDSKEVDVTHLDDVKTGAPEWLQIREEAMRAEETEKQMGLMEGLRNYPTAVFWSFAISLCISEFLSRTAQTGKADRTLVMEGYDTMVLGNIIGLPQFRHKYGYDTGKGNEDNRYQLPASWQMAINQGPGVGNVLGILLASWMQDRWGYKRTIQINLIALTGFIFIVFFAPNVQTIFAGEFLCGFPWGAFASSAVSYASDVTPVPLRGYLTSYVNLCWIIGQLLGAGILKRVTSLPGENAYRIAFAIQWVWPLPIFILVTLAPESPWFLVRKGRLAEAKHVVERLSKKGEQVDAEATVAMMVRTNQFEIDNHVGASYIDCFKGVDRRRTEIACVSWVSQQWSGMLFCGAVVYFFEQAGFNPHDAFSLNVGVTAIAFVGTIISWVTITFTGRRPPILIGMTVLSIIMFCIGGLTWPADKGPGSPGAWGQAALVMIFVFVFDLSIGPLAYCVVGEVSSTRLRAKTVGLARIAYHLVSIGSGILNTYMVSATAFNLRGKAAFVWAGTATCCTIWAYFRLPEMKGRSYRELDILFERRIPARNFKETVINEEDDS